MRTRSMMRFVRALGILAALQLPCVLTFASRAAQAPQAPGTYLEREVRHQLLLLPYYTLFDWFEFSVDGYTVTLDGEVVQPVLKSDAENVVKHIEGVQKVVNNIKVLPLSNQDDGIRRAEFRTIYGHPALRDRYGFQANPPIHIIVDNGHVTLKGVVANDFDKNVAGVQANTVPGVFSVDNQLQVEQPTKGK
jgi:hyperosmotically inducible protein